MENLLEEINKKLEYYNNSIKVSPSSLYGDSYDRQQDAYVKGFNEVAQDVIEFLEELKRTYIENEEEQDYLKGNKN